MVDLHITVRPTRSGDVAALSAIERAAAGRFRDIPEFAWLADGEVITAEQHLDYAERGFSWLALANGRPVGFILTEAHASSLFIVELSVDRAWQGKGIGRQLIACAADHARKMGLTALTLTTFREVPWNAPYYRRLGFSDIEEADLDAALIARREAHIARGLDESKRVFMRRDLA
jgi:GNAT superfamily N-acetyltransferase